MKVPKYTEPRITERRWQSDECNCRGIMSRLHEPNSSFDIPECEFPVLSHNDRDGGSSEGSLCACRSALCVGRWSLTRKHSLAMLHTGRAPKFGAQQGTYESIGGSQALRTEITERRPRRHVSGYSSLSKSQRPQFRRTNQRSGVDHRLR